MAKEEKIKFEEKMEMLEKIVNELEKDDVNLDESIEKYTKAMKLVKECDDELKDIEARVSKIVAENGSLEDFSIED